MPSRLVLQFSDVLVAVVVVMSLFVLAFVLAVVLVPATVIPIVVMVPVMVMLATPVGTVPVASIVMALCVVWNDPGCSNIWRASPIASVPMVMTLHRIPVALDPHEAVIFRLGAGRANGDHLGCR